MNDEKPKPYSITPKGALAVHLGASEAERVWDILTNICQKKLDYREDRGIPCLILEGGGHVISVAKQSA